MTKDKAGKGLGGWGRDGPCGFTAFHTLYYAPLFQHFPQLIRICVIKTNLLQLSINSTSAGTLFVLSLQGASSTPLLLMHGRHLIDIFQMD